MPAVPFSIGVPLNGQIDVPLAPFDRFGGGGGRIAVRATVLAASSGDVNMTVMLGSDVVQSQAPVFGESVAGLGPTRETPVVGGLGAPGDPITIRLENTTGTLIVVNGIADIQNA